MGISKEQLLSALGISKGYSDAELSELEQRVNVLVQTLYDVIGLQDTPVGTIISYMGNTAPDHYLACDGDVYNISDYPILSQHILKEFKAVNYFGGDGETTFAVPDLRGEFLRGSGANSHTKNGGGAAVGSHQDGTQIPYIRTFVTETATKKWAINAPSSEQNIVNSDIVFDRNLKSVSHYADSTTAWDTTAPAYAVVRPTNTSVLYCMKYEPTYYLKTEIINRP